MTGLFPELRRDVERWGCSIYEVFFELLPASREAHKTGDIEALHRIYGFAEWCFEQKAKDLWNAAGVAFYEHLFDGGQSHWAEIVKWLSPKIVKDCWSLWEHQLSAEKLAEVGRLISERREVYYAEARLSRRD